MSELVETIVDEAFIKEMEQYRQPDKSVGLIEACSKSYVVFCEYMLGLKLYSWQVYVGRRLEKAVSKEDVTREFLALTSRQIGKSTLVASFSLWSCIFNKYPGTIHNNTIVGITSASDTQARKLLREMKKLMNSGDRYLREKYVDEFGKPMFGKNFFNDLLDPNQPNNTTTITYKAWKDNYGPFLLAGSKSGPLIVSYPPSASILGETFTIVIIDEAGKSERITDEFFYDYIQPTGNSTDAIRIYTSTPWTPSGFFYRYSDPAGELGDTNVDRVLFTIDAIKLENPEYHARVMKTVEQLNADGKTDEVQRAYYCRFVKGDNNYFIPDKVGKVFTVDYEMFDEYAGKCDLGIDFGGQVKSRSVLTISCMNEETKQVTRLYRRTYPVQGDLNMLSDIEDLMKRFNIQRIIPDDCPAGMHMILEMQNRGWNVHPMNFRSEKVKKYGAFRSTMNRGKIQSFEDPELRTEMLALEFGNTSTQSKIMAPPGYNDDLIDSFVLSCYFFVTEETNRVRFYNIDEI